MREPPSPADAARRVLRHAPWLDRCGDAVIDQLALACQARQIVTGTVIALRGDSALNLILVEDGAIELGMMNTAGKRHVTSWLGRGQIFGLIPVLDGGSMIHTATAIRPSRILLLPRSALLKALQDHPSLAMQLIHLIAERARAQYEAVAAKSLLSLPAQLARVLRVRVDDHAGHRVIATQSDLADLLGVTRQSLNQELRKMEREGILALGRGHIQVLDKEALIHKAGAGE